MGEGVGGGREGWRGGELGKKERKKHTTSACREKIKKWVIKLIYNAIGRGNNVILRKTRRAKNEK